MAGVLLQEQLNSILHAVPAQTLQNLFQEIPENTLNPLGINQQDTTDNPISAIDAEDAINAVPLNTTIGNKL